MNNKRNKQILTICCTVYQVILAVHLKDTVYKNDNVDIVIADTMNDSKRIEKRINKSRIFRKAINAKLDDYNKRINKYKPGGAIREFLLQYDIRHALPDMMNIKDKYDVLLAGNINYLSEMAYNYIRKYLNRDVKVLFYEDGLSAYSIFGWSIDTSIKSYTNRDRFFNHLFGKKIMAENIEALYTFYPELMQWKKEFPLIKIETMDKNNPMFLKKINYIFNYNDSHKDAYNEPVIFFEESYYADNLYINDISIVKQIASYVGKDNLLIKLHPRNKVDRFKELGLKTNQYTAVPWEVIILNNDFENKILISFASASIVMPYLLFGIKTKSISLLRAYKIKWIPFYRNLYAFLLNVIYKLDENVFFVPESPEELKKYLEEKLLEQQ